MPELDERQAASRILDLVIQRTEAGLLEWSPRQGRPQSFDVDLPSGNIEVGTSDNDGAAPHDFRVYKPGPEYGLVIELDGRSDPDFQPQMARLWELVDRKTRGVDEVLRNMLRDLGDEA